MNFKNKNNDLSGKVIYITTEDGKKLDAEILFTFTVDEYTFILYCIDQVIDGQEQSIVYGGKVDSDGDPLVDPLLPIDNDEWTLVEKMYEEYINEVEE